MGRAIPTKRDSMSCGPLLPTVSAQAAPIGLRLSRPAAVADGSATALSSLLSLQGGWVSRESRTAMVRTALAFLALGAAPCRSAAAQDVPLVIEHVTVIDVIAGRAQPDMTVEIRGRTIAALSPGPRVRAPGHARVIDGRGKYLIPGLWDMHVHVSWPAGAAQVFLPVMVANGVLGARDMHGTLEA